MSFLFAKFIVPYPPIRGELLFFLFFLCECNPIFEVDASKDPQDFHPVGFCFDEKDPTYGLLIYCSKRHMKGFPSSRNFLFSYSALLHALENPASQHNPLRRFSSNRIDVQLV